MIYEYKGKIASAKFDKFYNAFSLLDKIRDAKINLTDAKNDQEDFEKHLSEIKKGNPLNKSKEQKNGFYNIKMLNKWRTEVIKFSDDYSSMMSEAKIKPTKGTGLKILTRKQMLQRLPIALAQVKAGNNSENLLNEIRQIVYSLYQ